MPSNRKSKGDKKAKGKYMKYKRGGKYRSTDISYTNTRSDGDKRK